MKNNLQPQVLRTGIGWQRDFSLLIIALAIFIIPVYSQTYCTPSAANSCNTNAGNETISNFLLDSINNPSSCVPSNYIDFSSPTLYPNIETTLNSPGTYNYTVTALHADFASPYEIAIWIDLNNDGVFDSSELVGFRAPATDCGSFSCSDVQKSGTITIPANVTTGTKQLRVRMIFQDGSSSNAVDPCAEISYGEAEDFRVIIIGTTPGTNSVSVGTISPLTYCAGSTISIPFIATGTYNNGNIFTAQLSDGTGDFSSPVTIGTLTDTTSGTISGTVPSNALNGTGYLIRIISSSPADTSLINSAAITINQPSPVSATIQANPSGTICSGTNVNFTATPTNGGTNPGYQWLVNGAAAGTNSSSFSSNTLHNADTVVCVVTSNAACATGSPFTSNAIIMTVNNAAGAGTITALKDTLCSGEQVSLSDAGSSGNVQWQSSTDGNNFSNISSATDTTYSATLQQTTYYRVYTTSGSCNDTSSDLVVKVNALPAAPTITAGDTLICSNDSAHLCASSGYVSYLWNNGATSNCTYVNAAGGVWVTGTSANGCSNVSSHVNIAVYPVSSVSIIEEGDTLSTFGGTAYQWLRNDSVISGATSYYYLAAQPGNYSVAVTDSNGCVSTSATVPVSITGIDDILLNGELAIYPNPATGSFNIRYTGAAYKNFTLTLFNSLGERVMEKLIGLTNQAEIPVNISSLAAGVYLVQMQNGQQTVVKKIVVE